MDQRYITLLREELIPALGCTEPIAIAYAAATAARTLGRAPQHILCQCSGNIIKNVQSVSVPNSGGLKGVAAAAALGALGGDPALELNVLQRVGSAEQQAARDFLEAGSCEVRLLETSHSLHIQLTARAGRHWAEVEIRDQHTRIVSLKLDGRLLRQDPGCEAAPGQAARDWMSFGGILAFARQAPVEELRRLLEPQLTYNLAIAREGLSGSWGAGVGAAILRQSSPGDVAARARAYAAAGSDARMSGCTLPVVINSGSGNQGVTVCLPVWVYAQERKAAPELLYRALAVSNLVAIYQKSSIGRPSAFCGVVGAACGCGAGIAFLEGRSDQVIGNTVINTLGNISGMVCDGAKPSCAAKIASAVDAALLGYQLAQQGYVFADGDGLMKDGIEKTLRCIGRLGRDGMRGTDEEILHLMLEDDAVGC